MINSMLDTAEFYTVSFLLDEIMRVRHKDDQQRYKREKFADHLTAEEKVALEKEASFKKETKLYGLTQALRTNLRSLGLPEDLVVKILRLAVYAQTGSNIVDVRSEIERLKRLAAEAVRQQNRTAEAVNPAAEMLAAGTAAALAPQFFHALYSKEAFEKKMAEHSDKVVEKIIRGVYKMAKPRKAKETYKTKKGSQQPRKQLQLDKDYKNQLLDLYVERVQNVAKEAGLPVPTREEVLDAYNKMEPAQQRYELKNIETKNPAVVEKHKEAERAVAAIATQKALKRTAKKRNKREKYAAKKAAQAARQAKQQDVQQNTKTKQEKTFGNVKAVLAEKQEDRSIKKAKQRQKNKANEGKLKKKLAEKQLENRTEREQKRRREEEEIRRAKRRNKKLQRVLKRQSERVERESRQQKQQETVRQANSQIRTAVAKEPANWHARAPRTARAQGGKAPIRGGMGGKGGR